MTYNWLEAVRQRHDNIENALYETTEAVDDQYISGHIESQLSCAERDLQEALDHNREMLDALEQDWSIAATDAKTALENVNEIINLLVETDIIVEKSNSLEANLDPEPDEITELRETLDFAAPRLRELATELDDMADETEESDYV